MTMIMTKSLHFPLWWYRDSLLWWKRFFKNLLIFLDNKLAVSLMLRMLFIPLFHDVSFLGRILSFIFRVVRVIVGGLIIILTLVSMVFWFLVWLALPIILIITTGWAGAGGLLLVGFLDVIKQWRQDYLNSEVKKIVRLSGKNSENLKKLLWQDQAVKQILKLTEITEDLSVNLELSDWLVKAKEEALTLKAEYVGTKHLLLALLKQEDWRYEEAKSTVKWLEAQSRWGKTPFIWDKSYEPRPIGGIDRAWTGIPTPTLDKFSLDLTKMAQKHQLPEMFGKEEVTDQMTQILSRREKNNVLVIGEPGSGKSTLVKSLAQEIVRGVKAKSLRFKRLISLDISRLAAGANDAVLNQRITEIIAEIKAAGNIILFVDEVHNLAMINQDSAESSDIFMALEPSLSEGEFQFIGATTTDNYKKYLEPNEAFSRLFEVVDLAEATPRQTMEILQYLAWEQQQTEAVTVTLMALQTIIELSQALIHDRVLPDKAVNILDEAVAVVKSKDLNLVTVAEVRQLLTKKTKVPLNKLTGDDVKLLLNLEKKLHQRVIGQDKAITAIASAIRRARTGLKDQHKPIASFLFAGPTGVGKTETAKTLASEFFGSEKVMIRLDMSEFQTVESVDRLLELLTDAVGHQPYTLILLDEIEKAHAKIINLFLQVLDDARLTNLNGKTADFANTIIIATTNVGTSLKNNPKGAEVLEKIEAHFPPEWLNRFTGLIVFDPLSEKEVEAVVKLKLNKLSRELLKQELEISFDEAVIKQLSREGFSTKWGGRQVDRIIQERVANVIAEKILKGEVKKRQPFTFSL
ncbi:ATP-dependent Clp protease ATP-binding subunit [Patescibacteria group bacterium]|nr:ATP-dependent Clp protease ATP-binding subunit [Patescibacteria group bacterium]